MKSTVVTSAVSGFAGAALLLLVVGLGSSAFAHAAEAQAGSRQVAISAPLAPAGEGTRLTYQGRLTGNNGAPFNSQVQMIFKLYDASGGVLWTSATRNITPTNGVFTVYLGDGADPGLSGELFTAASIGVTVGGDEEMTPRQPLNTVVGHHDSYFGVLGTSTSGLGVNGVANTGVGVLGRATSDSGVGVAATGAGPSGTALQIFNGAIKVLNAGVGTNTAVFVHPVGASAPQSCIDHPMLNNAPGAILFVTVTSYFNGITNIGSAKPVGVYYNVNASPGCSVGRWMIFNLDGSVLTSDVRYNVMVIKP